MKENDLTKYSPIELRDTKLKIELYVNKVCEEGGPPAKMEKLCHLAVETFMKCGDNQDFALEIFQFMKEITQKKKNYYLLYLVDLMLKNNKYVIRTAKKDIDSIFKIVWGQVFNQPKNSHKLECLKAMVRTWGILYGHKIEESLGKWLESKYRVILQLSDKNEELLAQSYEKYRHGEKQKTQSYNVLLTEVNKSTTPSKMMMNFKNDGNKEILKALDI